MREIVNLTWGSFDNILATHRASGPASIHRARDHLAADWPQVEAGKTLNRERDTGSLGRFLSMKTPPLVLYAILLGATANPAFSDSLPPRSTADAAHQLGQAAKVSSSYKERADRLLAEGPTGRPKYNEAFSDYQQYLNHGGGADADAWYHAALCAARLGRRKLSVDDFNHAANLYGTKLNGYLSRCDANLETQDRDRALQSVSDACRLFPNEFRTYWRLGYFHHKYGEYKEAIAAYTTALQKQAMGTANDDSTLLEELPGRPTLARLYGLRAECFYKTANYNAAIADCTKYIELRPKSSAALEARAEALIKLDDYAGAERDLEQAVELKTQRPRTYKQLGLCQVKLAKYNKAQTNLSKAVELFPKYAEAYELRGKVMEKLGNQLAAARDSTKAIGLGLGDSP